MAPYLTKNSDLFGSASETETSQEESFLSDFLTPLAANLLTRFDLICLLKFYYRFLGLLMMCPTLSVFGKGQM